jgi:protein-disulfide isomerase
MKSTKRPVKQSSTSGISATWWIVGLIAAIVGVGLIAAIGLPSMGAARTTVTAGKVQGLATAPITLEEYADFQCPACGAYARGAIKQIEEKYVKNGTVKIVFHQFAFVGTDQYGTNSESIRAAEAAECANEQNKFWEFYDTLFANQAGENQGAFADDKLSGFARGLGLDMAAFSTCFSSRKYLTSIQSETADGQQRGVSSTPTSFINGKKAVGAISMQQFEAAIEPLLPK